MMPFVWCPVCSLRCWPDSWAWRDSPSGQKSSSSATQTMPNNLKFISRMVLQCITQRGLSLLQDPASGCKHPKVAVPQNHTRVHNHVMWLGGTRQAREHVLQWQFVLEKCLVYSVVEQLAHIDNFDSMNLMSWGICLKKWKTCESKESLLLHFPCFAKQESTEGHEILALIEWVPLMAKTMHFALRSVTITKLGLSMPAKPCCMRTSSGAMPSFSRTQHCVGTCLSRKAWQNFMKWAKRLKLSCSEKSQICLLQWLSKGRMHDLKSLQTRNIYCQSCFLVAVLSLMSDSFHFCSLTSWTLQMM